MAILCPCFTLDMLAKILAIGLGTLSGAKRIEELSYLACLSVLVNYMTFLTFFPACLSLALEVRKLRLRPSNSRSHPVDPFFPFSLSLVCCAGSCHTPGVTSAQYGS
jgi:hypothetical protein